MLVRSSVTPGPVLGLVIYVDSLGRQAGLQRGNTRVREWEGMGRLELPSSEPSPETLRRHSHPSLSSRAVALWGSTEDRAFHHLSHPQTPRYCTGFSFPVPLFLFKSSMAPLGGQEWEVSPGELGAPPGQERKNRTSESLASRPHPALFSSLSYLSFWLS